MGYSASALPAAVFCALLSKLQQPCHCNDHLQQWFHGMILQQRNKNRAAASRLLQVGYSR
jgi:hypothetical protein